MQTNPEMFGSNHVKESAYSDAECQDGLNDPNRAFYGVYHQDEVIGVTGVVLVKEDFTKAALAASFLRPSYRGKGLAKLMYEARLDWAREKKCESIIVSHRDGNEASKAANQRFGFEFTHTKETVWPDNVTADEHYYALKL